MNYIIKYNHFKASSTAFALHSQNKRFPFEHLKEYQRNRYEMALLQLKDEEKTSHSPFAIHLQIKILDDWFQWMAANWMTHL